MADTFEHHSVNAGATMLQLRDFLHDCVASGPCDEADRVREAMALLPRTTGTHTVEPCTFERMLDCGAALDAVLAIIGNGTPLMLSRGEGQTFIATVLAGDGPEEMVSEGATLALALLAAYVSARLVSLERRMGLGEAATVPLAARLH